MVLNPAQRFFVAIASAVSVVTLLNAPRHSPTSYASYFKGWQATFNQVNADPIDGVRLLIALGIIWFATIFLGIMWDDSKK